MKHAYTQLARLVASCSLALGLMLPGVAGATNSPSFTILSPAQGSVVSSPVLLQIDVQGAKIGQPIEGLDHLHLSVDGGGEVAVYRNRLLHLQLDPGKHTISVELAGPTHEGLLPPKSVSFTVR